jgi:iron(III) transport system substrate-binding protein
MMRMTRLTSFRSSAHWLLILCLTQVLLSGCTRQDADGRHVVVYVSADDALAREVIAAFESKTGLDVRMVGDTEAKKTTGLVERLRNERDRPQADIFWSSEIFLTIQLADEGILAPYTSTALADWPDTFRDEQGRWYGFAGRARVIAYAPERVDEADLPVTWQDICKPQYAGRIVMADPRFGTTGGHLGAMHAYWSDAFDAGAYGAFIDGLAANETRMLPSGNAGVVRAIVTGEADLGFTDTDDVWAARRNGADIRLLYPRHHPDASLTGGGTLVIPNTVARVAGGPNPDAAGQFIEFMLSEDTERMLAESVSRNIPLGPGRSDAFETLHVPDPLAVDFRAAALARQDAVEFAMRRLHDDNPATADHVQ